jgi:hypothetical protein
MNNANKTRNFFITLNTKFEPDQRQLTSDNKFHFQCHMIFAIKKTRA